MTDYQQDDDAPRYSIRDSGKSHFTMIPNIVFEMGLSAYAVRLYCELKKVAGEGGKSWVNTEHLSERCCISTGSVSTAKQELLKEGLITIESKEANHYHEITIVDIWERNVQERPSLSTGEGALSTGERPLSTGERINIPINKIQDTARKEKHHLTSEEYKEQTRQSLKKWEEKNIIPNIDKYPEDVRSILVKVCSIWKISCPPRKSADAGYWIKGARALEEACEGHPDVVLLEIQQDLTVRRHRNSVTIASPNSLVNMARAKVGELKVKAENKTIIPPGAQEVWIGGVRFER